MMKTGNDSKIHMLSSSAGEVLTSFKGAWGFLLLCWLPAYLASWPGVFVIDNVFQMKWYLEGNVSAHHPVLHTYLLCGLMDFGKKFLGSYEWGMCIFVVLQMLFLSGVFSYTLKKLERYMGIRIRLLFLLLFALLPYNPVSAFTTTKDTVFAGFFLLVLLQTYLAVCDPEAFFTSPKRMSAYVVLVFLMCAFRNTGIYIFVFSLPVFLFVCRKYWKKGLAVGLSCILLWGFYTGPVYQMLDVGEGSSAEMLSVPIQQMARVMVNESGDLSVREREMISEYLPDWERYASRVSDPVKDTFNSELFDKDPLRFLGLWIRTGLKCPLAYVEAFLSTNIGFWNPLMQYPDPETYLPYIPYHSADEGQVGVVWEGQVIVGRSQLLPETASFYEKMTESGSYNQLPGLCFVYNIAAAFWMIAAGMFWCIRKKRYFVLPPFFFLIGLWGTLMLSPVVVFRYGYPLLISLPIVWAMCGFGKTGESSADKKHQKLAEVA